MADDTIVEVIEEHRVESRRILESIINSRTSTHGILYMFFERVFYLIYNNGNSTLSILRIGFALIGLSNNKDIFSWESFCDFNCEGQSSYT